MKVIAIAEIEFDQSLFESYARREQKSVDALIAEAAVALEERLARALRSDAVSHSSIRILFESARTQRLAEATR